MRGAIKEMYFNIHVILLASMCTRVADVTVRYTYVHDVCLTIVLVFIIIKNRHGRARTRILYIMNA